MSTLSDIRKQLEIPTRLGKAIPSYLISLLNDTEKHSLTFASSQSGLAPSQFSRLLSGHKEIAFKNLNRLARKKLKKLLRTRKFLTPGVPWTVAIIIDATLHERSSAKIENAQKFNHGNGWVIGHQWTNIVLLINGEVIPLPPIPFHTSRYAKKLGIEYKTEPEMIIDFLADTNWEELLPGVSKEEIVVLMDSGYDNKKLQNFIQMQGWTFICSIKKSRSVYTETQGIQRVDAFFKNTRKIGQWKTVRTNSGKGRREFRVRILTGVMKGTDFQVSLACSEKNYGDRLYLACSFERATEGIIARTYKLRWTVEIFHRNIKSYLGFQDVGCEKFESVMSHVYWVYCAYILSSELSRESLSFFPSRKALRNRLEDEKLGLLLKMNARADSKKAIAKYYSSVRTKLGVA